MVIATADVVETLSKAEQRLFQRLEDAVERGKGAFIDVADALLEIRQKRLHRQTHPNWEDYCRARWGFGRAYANMIIRAGAFAKECQAQGLPVPATEFEARQRRDTARRERPALVAPAPKLAPRPPRERGPIIPPDNGDGQTARDLLARLRCLLQDHPRATDALNALTYFERVAFPWPMERLAAS
jgi:hypothetical protein